MAALLLVLASRTAAAQDFVEQWCRYEKSLVTVRDYQTNDNPYRKILLNVTFTPQAGTCLGSAWCSAFTVPGFWDGGKVFKIRGTFPPGTWNWSATCSGTSNGNNCATDPALDSVLDASQTTSTALGSVVVSNGAGQCDPAQTRTYDLLEKGLPRISTNTSGLKSLTYGDGVTPYHWRADTTWKGPVTEIKDPANTVGGVFNPLKWKQFLDNRRDKNFNTLLIAVASSADDPATGTQWLFEDLGTSCTGATWPKSCSRWRPLKYWRQYDEIVKLANDRGFLVVINAVMDPLGNPNSGTPLYPDPADARIFARNLTARMAGSHVLFSPSLDDRLSLTSTLIDAVGAELRTAAPRSLITAHLAGTSSICDYVSMHNKSWHQIHLFQSGHALNVSSACPGLTGTDAYECSVYRARVMPDWLAPNPTSEPPGVTCIPSTGLTPVKPNGNAEAAYDAVDNPTSQTIDSAYGVRHTGYATGLNGSFAVTLGVEGIYNWTNPIGRLETAGASHLKILNNLLNLNPWQMLQRRTQRIKNQPVASEQDKFMIMAATSDSKLAMIYMPDNAEVKFDGSFLVGFDCSKTDLGGWNITWVNPRTSETTVTGTCANISDPTGATRILRRPNNTCPSSIAGDNGDCDWIVQIRKNGFYLPPSQNLAAWAEPVEDGWRIVGRRRDTATPLGEPFEISEPTSTGQIARQPVVAGDAEGYFIVWEEQNGDDQFEVLLRRLDGQGRLIDHEYAVNLTHEMDQTNPWAATHPTQGGGVVVWSSYAQDGDLTGIFARLINPAGVPYGPEIPVNESTTGRQDFPEVVMFPDGSFVVAWTSTGQDGEEEGVFARRFDDKGRPMGPELQVHETTDGAQWLSDLAPSGRGFSVTWTSYGPKGSDRGVFIRSYDENGAPLSGEQLIVPPGSFEAESTP